MEVYCAVLEAFYIHTLTLLGLQSRFGGNWEQITRNLRALSPKPDWSSKGVKTGDGVTFSLPVNGVG